MPVGCDLTPDICRKSPLSLQLLCSETLMSQRASTLNFYGTTWSLHSVRLLRAAQLGSRMTESRWLKRVEQRTFSICLPPAAESIPANSTGRPTSVGFPPELPPTSTSWPPFLPAGLQTPLKGGCSHSWV